MATPLCHAGAERVAWKPQNIVMIEVQNLNGETFMEYQVDSTKSHQNVSELQRQVLLHLQAKRHLELR